MSLATLPLPDDPTALRDLAVDLQAELARKDIEIAANAAEIHARTISSSGPTKFCLQLR